MFEEITKKYKVKDYLALFSILALGFGLFLFFGYNRAAQKLVVLATAGGYVVWGIVHHALQKDLHLSVMVEYILVAFLTSVVILSLLGRT